MTREEAINRLEDTFEAWEGWVPHNGSPANKLSEALGMAISALREQEERSKGCEFCREDNEGYYRMLGTFYLTNPFHKGEYYLNGGGRKPRKINFCPMCGRELEVDVDVEA